MLALVKDSDNAEQAESKSSLDSTISFIRAYPDTLPVMSADRSALGSVPAQAYMYCEALCTASAFGWYVFPPIDIRLFFDGVDVYLDVDGQWVLLSSTHLPGVEQWWDEQCPEQLRGMAPPFLTNLGIPGHVQIWSGLLVKSQPDWSILVRPLANVQTTQQFFCYEGIVETDTYSPAPLFTNVKLTTTNSVIEIPAHRPMFQVQPIHRSCYGKNTLKSFDCEDLFDAASGDCVMSAEDWFGYGSTVRAANPAADMHSLGQYAAATRKRGKRESAGM